VSNGVLSLGVQKDSRISIGPYVMRVIEVLGDGRLVSIEVADQRFMISEEERTEVLPEVFVFCGVPNTWNSSFRSRLAFEAPIAIRINRIEV
jgi:hypothetical protein